MAPGEIKARLAGFDWRADNAAEFAGLSFYFDDGLAGEAPSPDQTYVFKPKAVFEAYAEVLDGEPLDRVIELGLWSGGSALVLAAMLDMEKLVAVDIRDPVESFDAVRASHPLGRRIAVHYHTSQDDEAKLSAIVDAEFDGPVDLVIDDASHFYAPSRASFEILFPRLRPGGWYIIEDWGWAHSAMGGHWKDEPSLAGLIFELQLAWFCSPQLIGRVIVQREMVFIQKAAEAPVGSGRLALSGLYALHHRSPPLVA